MDIENPGQFALRGLNKINILLGKNGSGKSTLLKKSEEYVSGLSDTWGSTQYITPERGGVLIYDASTEQSLSNNPNWLKQTRRVNQFVGFRQQSLIKYKRLELSVLREIEDDRAKPGFGEIIEKLNSLLENIQIIRDGDTFKIVNKSSGETVKPQSISSGEAELISMGIECLSFARDVKTGKNNVLFIDSPDVHLHPDLQAKLMKFLKELVEHNNFIVLVATHSTALLGALCGYDYVHVAFMGSGEKEVTFKAVSEADKKILPIFGAHPLSNIFNEKPPLLVEGDDDERVWQQAVKTSGGSIKLYPCGVDGISKLDEFEQEVRRIISSVYSDAHAYSLRDGDGVSDEIKDEPPIIRFRLKCKAIENLLLTNEVLRALSNDWDGLRSKMDDWIIKTPDHPNRQKMILFQRGGYDRKNFDLKDVRNTLLYIIISVNTWELCIGKVLGKLQWEDTTDFNVSGSIYNFLGEKLVKQIFPKKTS